MYAVFYSETINFVRLSLHHIERFVMTEHFRVLFGICDATLFIRITFLKLSLNMPNAITIDNESMRNDSKPRMRLQARLKVRFENIRD